MRTPMRAMRTRSVRRRSAGYVARSLAAGTALVLALLIAGCVKSKPPAKGPTRGATAGRPAEVDRPPAARGGGPVAPADRWRPSEWGPQDQRGAANRVTAQRVAGAAKLISQGTVYSLGRVYEQGMPLVGNRHFSLTIPGSPTGG